jgi:hypothetical protein
MEEQKKHIIEQVRNQKSQGQSVTEILEDLSIKRSTYYSWGGPKKDTPVKRLEAEPGKRLGNTRLACSPYPDRGIRSPLDPLQDTTKHLPVRGLHIERERNNIVDHHVRG